jgi:hypothetical protein
LRPLARRRFRTSRPFLVAMRARKPCVFARRRLLGWKVRLDIDRCSPLQTKTTRLNARRSCVKKRRAISRTEGVTLEGPGQLKPVVGSATFSFPTSHGSRADLRRRPSDVCPETVLAHIRLKAHLPQTKPLRAPQCFLFSVALDQMITVC